MAKKIEFETKILLNGQEVMQAEPSQEVTDILCREFLAQFLKQKSEGTLPPKTDGAAPGEK